MNRLANLLIASDGKVCTARWKDALVAGGYSVSVGSWHDLTASLHHERPDLVLLISAEKSQDGPTIARHIKIDKNTANIPVLLLCPHVDGDLCDQALQAGIDDVIAVSCDDAELLARLRPLVRLSTMHSELRHRARTAADFSLDMDDRVGIAVGEIPSVLVVGNMGDTVSALLGQVVSITQVDTVFDADVVLDQRNFDATILAFASISESCLGFCTQVRNNPRLFNMPVLLITAEKDDADDAYRRGATRVLRRPLDKKILVSAVLTLVRRQQLRWNIRTALDRSLVESTRDCRTQAYSKQFFDTHLAARIQTACQQERHLSIICLSAPTMEDIRRQFGEDAYLHLSGQLRQWICGLLRAEDLTASTALNEFCVILPDTPLHEAQVVMHRIAGVLAYTDFAVREVYQPIKVWVRVGATSVMPGDDVASVMCRVRSQMD